MQKHNYLIPIIIMSFLFIASAISYAQTSQIRNQLFIGARPMGMGETFVAVADDGNAIYWNPAGLPGIDRYELCSMYSNLFNIGAKNNYISLVVPYSEKLAFGLDWFNIGFNDDELGFSRNAFNFSLGAKLIDGLSAGMNIKRLTTDASLDGHSEASAAGWGADFGVLFSPGSILPILEGLKFGVMAHDFTDTKITYGNDVSEAILFRNVRYGISYHFNKLFFFERPLFALDIDDRIHFGTELWLPSLMNIQLGFRAGTQKDIYAHGEEGYTNSFGTSIKYQVKDRYLLNFDYSYTDAPAIMNTSRFALGFSFSLPSSPVKIDTVHIDDIYASLYPYHAETSCGLLKCSYENHKKLNATIRLIQSHYDISSETDVIFNPEMQPGDTLKAIDLRPIFSEEILTAQGEEKVRANIEIQSKSLMRIKPERKPSNDFTIYGIGKINWEYGEEQAAAFITPDDPIIRDLAVATIKKHQDSPVEINEAISHASWIFNNLGEQKISYLGDAKSMYGKKPIDTICYPRELLAIKMGDCDDTTVLLASLYQGVGISTALVSTHGHIFMMFDTGINRAKRLIMSLPEEMYCINNNRIWIPVETTWIGKSFIEAWEQGAKEINEPQRMDDLKIIEVKSAWQKYKPIPAKTLERIISKPEVIAALIEQDTKQHRKTITSRQQEYIDKMENLVHQNPDSIEIRNELATTYAMTGNTSRARFHYSGILKQDSANFNALNNMANLYFLTGILDSAQAFYYVALSNAGTPRDSNGVYLNLGTLYAAADSIELTYEMYANVVRDIRDSVRAGEILIARSEQLLGLTFDEIEISKADEKKKLKKISAKKVKKLVKETSVKKSKAKGKKISTTIATKGRKPPEEIEDVFFWAY